MEEEQNDKGQTVERNNETVTSMHARPQASYAPMGRTNINDINKRNAEQEKQEKKSSYKATGILIFAMALIVIVIYAFS